MSDLAQQLPAKWWHRWMKTPSELREMGVVGINMRNARYLLPNNPRRLYRLVDDKLQTKALAEKHDIDIPATYGVITSPRQISEMETLLAEHESFVIKPTRGSGGKGVLVIDGHDGDAYLKPSGARLTLNDLKHHVSNILAGLFSLGGTRDAALIEYRVRPAKMMTLISHQGAPDIRVVLMHGYPVMAMLRAATLESDGRANLHQGALGIGIDLKTGTTTRAVHHGKSVTHHPDTDLSVLGIQLPGWERIMEMSVICQEMTGLGYLGVDLMIDEAKGPMMIEVNARPGLAIQMANGIGLMKRLEPIIARHASHPDESMAQKLAFSVNSLQLPKPSSGLDSSSVDS